MRTSVVAEAQDVVSAGATLPAPLSAAYVHSYIRTVSDKEKNSLFFKHAILHTCSVGDSEWNYLFSRNPLFSTRVLVSVEENTPDRHFKVWS